ncbi:ankyrin repeat-containing domain protein [Limtongia smithiae]|uniref:ankyrin repeat-containing domain protein n=1 Tax=Limtongia smithiae TaxID=1125753 RepID=UPI0034CE635D
MTDEEADPYPLHTAARDGKELTVRNFIKQDRTLVARRDEDGRTPLFWAVSSGHESIVQALITAATDPDGQLSLIDIDDVDDAGWTVTHIAASIGSLPVLDILLPYHPSLDKQTSAGQTPLHYAVSRMRYDVVKRLLEAFPGAVRIRDKQGLVPLHRAASIGNIPMITELLKAKSPLDPADKSGWTPLFHASAEGHGDAALLLIRTGADTQKMDREGSTFLDVAADEKVKKWIIDMAGREGIRL